MKNPEFYHLEFGVHTMKLPKSTEYEIILSGWGKGEQKGARITMKKYFRKNTKIKFFIWRGVFLFDDENNLLAVAGSAGSRYEFTDFDVHRRRNYRQLILRASIGKGMAKSSASLTPENDQSEKFRTKVAPEDKGYG